MCIQERHLFNKNKNEPYVKKGDSPMFYVAMGCYDGAEVCELVGLCIIHNLSSTYPDGSIGLHSDERLALFLKYEQNHETKSGESSVKSLLTSV